MLTIHSVRYPGKRDKVISNRVREGAASQGEVEAKTALLMVVEAHPAVQEPEGELHDPVPLHVMVMGP